MTSGGFFEGGRSLLALVRYEQAIRLIDEERTDIFFNSLITYPISGRSFALRSQHFWIKLHKGSVKLGLPGRFGRSPFIIIPGTAAVFVVS